MAIMLKIVIVVSAAFLGYFSHYVGPFKDVPNNPIEEIAEDVIQVETGKKINLSDVDEED